MGSQVYYESPIIAPESTSAGSDRITIASFGELGFFKDAKSLLEGVTVNIYGKTTNAANDAYLHTFIVIPNDEWIGNYGNAGDSADLPYGYHLNVDPLSQPKMHVLACGRTNTTLYNAFMWDDRSPHLPMIREKNAQRLWLFHPSGVVTNNRLAYCAHTGMFSINSIKRYFSSITP
jgi:hypothetical protein